MCALRLEHNFSTLSHKRNDFRKRKIRTKIQDFVKTRKTEKELFHVNGESFHFLQSLQTPLKRQICRGHINPLPSPPPPPPSSNKSQTCDEEEDP